ncbi:copper/iron-regulated glutamine amidotransferase [Penicillium alfredii]|uniref:Copper/iron-regulated glutamine amidotransferase n=1 Tax=Penicillium alfredii TaxID=1506179 RepID=A0A9W9KQY6_9EURO|nr:copper/iron-regulated glutamine amidotransferase [Penicillium alfredii]KAJ5114960.1 copper/iron-regulated glutamine amidotransferase [Penicillium alfredii]
MDIPTPKIAVLVNTPPENHAFWTDVRQAWQQALTKSAPSVKVDLYDPVFEKDFPDPLKYDLIVLSGGKADASSSEPWVLGVLDFVRATAREAPKTKMLGICWGHQAVARALGGEVGAVSTGPIAAIQDIPLTDAGKEFFPFAAGTGSYRAPEFHVREVSKPAPGFISLASNHECFVNKTNTILSFQAHPEISNDLAKKMLLEEDKEYNGNSTAEQLEAEVQKLEQPTDGVDLLNRVIQWLRE